MNVLHLFIIQRQLPPLGINDSHMMPCISPNGINAKQHLYGTDASHSIRQQFNCECCKREYMASILFVNNKQSTVVDASGAGVKGLPAAPRLMVWYWHTIQSGAQSSNKTFELHRMVE
jgi:hypothetical protein